MSSHARLEPTAATALLHAAFRGDGDAWKDLERLIKRTVGATARRLHIADGHRTDFVEVVAQEVALAVLQAGPSGFHEERGSAVTWLWSLSSAKASQYLAGRPTFGRRRPRKGEKVSTEVLEPFVSADEASTGELLDPAATANFESAEARLDADVLLQKAPRDVARGLRAMHWDGHTLSRAAESLGVNRLTFSRRVRAFRLRVAEAMVA